MSFTYENVEKVEVKEDFAVHTYDCCDEIVDTNIIKKGSIGTVESAHYETGEPEAYYGISFGELDVAIYESNFEKRFNLLNAAQ